MQSLVRLISITCALFGSAGAFAVSDLIGTSGTYTRETGTRGAVANREIANQLYKQALADEKAAWSSFPPNVSLLSKALNESKEGKLADDQAKEFARAAMHGINSGGRSGDFKLQDYGVISEKELNDLANGSSPYRGAVESKLGGYGMKLSSDKMSIQTPIGTLPINMAMDKLEGGLRKIAASMGYNPDDVSSGLRAAVATRDGIAGRVMADVNSRMGQPSGGGAGGAMDPASLAGNEGANAGEAGKDAQGAGEGGAAGNGEAGFVQDDASRQAELQRNRDAFLRKMGAMDPESLGPLHGPNDDLFRIVHVKYQSLRSEGVFNENEITQLMASAAKPASAVRASPSPKVATRLPAANNGPIKPMNGTPK
jgi:hypothetical protein